MVIYWKEIVHNVNFRNIFQYHWNKWGVIFCKELWKNKFLYIYDDHDRLGKWFFFCKNKLKIDLMTFEKRSRYLLRKYIKINFNITLILHFITLHNFW